ncbi:hypothetical protein [Pueribacillus sp. YX66]|uniref:hypothetical protein n=1 Tax=Pueribacillus sp. YX66 TaxID=3229242 RepID=UPI00358D7FB2
MDYTARIQQLETLRSSVSSKQISSLEVVLNFSGEIPSWNGGVSQDGYLDLIQDTKEQVSSIYSAKPSLLDAIDTRITQLKAKIESQYNQHLYVVNRTYDSEDPVRNRQLKRQALNRLTYLDSTVRARLSSRI